jgi:hypothetical protein
MSKVYIFGLIFATKVHLSGESSIIKKRKKRKTGKPKPKELVIYGCNGVFSE